MMSVVCSMDIILKVASSYEDVRHSHPVIVRVDSVYYDDEDGTLVIMGDVDSYGFMMSMERYSVVVCDIFYKASTRGGFVDLTTDFGTFVEEPDMRLGAEEYGCSSWDEVCSKYRSALRSVLQ